MMLEPHDVLAVSRQQRDFLLPCLHVYSLNKSAHSLPLGVSIHSDARGAAAEPFCDHQTSTCPALAPKASTVAEVTPLGACTLHWVSSRHALPPYVLLTRISCLHVRSMRAM